MMFGELTYYETRHLVIFPTFKWIFPSLVQVSSPFYSYTPCISANDSRKASLCA